jgi:hypothetical protein
MPSYIESLMSTAEAAGVSITEQEALQWALTGVAPAAIEAAGGIDEIGESDGLSKLGEEADAASASIEEVVGKIQALGQEFRSTFLAEGDMYAAIDNFTQALAENGATLDATTEAGQRNRQALVDMFDASEGYAASILEAGGSTDEAAGAMRTAYDTMVDNAEAMGLTKGEAKELAAELLDLPDGVDIDTFFDNAAQEMAMALANEIEAIPEHKTVGIAAQEDGSFVSVQQKVDELGNVTATVIVDADGNVTEVTEEIREINGHEMTVYVDAEGNVYEIEEELDELEKRRPQSTIEVDADTSEADLEMGNLEDGRYESTVEVDANTEGAQSEIDNIDSTSPATVDTTADTSGASVILNEFGLVDWPATIQAQANTDPAAGSIEGVVGRPWSTTITGLGNMGAAEEAANTAARGRNTTFTGIPNVGAAEGSLNTTGRQRNPLFLGVPSVGNAEGTLNTTGRQRNPLFLGVPSVGAAEGQLNTTGRQRNPLFLGIPNTGTAEGNLNTTARDRNSQINAVKGSDGVSSWLSGLTRARSVVVDVVRRITGNTGGIANSFGAAGHFSQELPRRATGGRLPYTGLGTDMILGRNRHGVPTAWVDDGEWIIREQMSRKYHNALGLINMDHPSVHHLAEHNAGGQAGRARLGSTVPNMGNINVNVPSQQMPTELTGTLYMEDGALLGQVRMAMRDPSVTRVASQQLASQSSRDRRGLGSRVR